MNALDSMFQPQDILKNLRRNAELGHREPAMTKNTAWRCRWLIRSFERHVIDVKYFHEQFRQMPDSIKREFDGVIKP